MPTESIPPFFIWGYITICILFELVPAVMASWMYSPKNKNAVDLVICVLVGAGLLLVGVNSFSEFCASSQMLLGIPVPLLVIWGLHVIAMLAILAAVFSHNKQANQEDREEDPLELGYMVNFLLLLIFAGLVISAYRTSIIAFFTSPLFIAPIFVIYVICVVLVCKTTFPKRHVK